MYKTCVCCQDDNEIVFSKWPDDLIVYDEELQEYFCRKHANMLYSEIGPEDNLHMGGI